MTYNSYLNLKYIHARYLTTSYLTRVIKVSNTLTVYMTSLSQTIADKCIMLCCCSNWSTDSC
jgi:hypothetical protein